MKYSFFTVSIVFLFLFFGCNSDPNSENTPDTSDIPETEAPLAVTLDSLVKKGGGPCKTGTDCMEVKLTWPVVQGGNPNVRQTLNDSIQQYLIYHLQFNPDMNGSNIEQISDSLIAEFKAVFDSNEAYGLGWVIDVNGNMTFHDSIAILEIFNYSFTGGAHGNYFTEYTNFNTNNGELIQYENFVWDSTAFATIVEAAFYKSVKQISEQNELTPEDFFWGEGFFLPPNFKLGKESIEFIYNPYEAAAYVYGQMEFSVPYSELKKSTTF